MHAACQENVGKYCFPQNLIVFLLNSVLSLLCGLRIQNDFQKHVVIRFFTFVMPFRIYLTSLHVVKMPNKLK